MTIGSDGAGETSASSEVQELSTDGRTQSTGVGVSRCSPSNVFHFASSFPLFAHAMPLARATVGTGQLYVHSKHHSSYTAANTITHVSLAEIGCGTPCMIYRTSHRDLSTSQEHMRNKSADLSIPLHLGITNAMRLPYVVYRSQENKTFPTYQQ
jgi:hypothetical protein